MIKDHQGRSFQSLRVSLTTACNLSCTYCVPEGEQLKCKQNELSSEEIVKAVRLLVSYLGITKVRLTGGEPLISRKLDTLLPQLKALGISDISLTTNGQTLEKKAAFLKENGMDRINVSLDTLDVKNFTSITRGGDLEKTLRGIKQAQQEGIRVKVNMIPIRNMNEGEILSMLDYCLDHDIELRYIELMRMGHLAQKEIFEKKVVPKSFILEQIGEKYSIQEGITPLSATATRYMIPGRGSFGIIANDSAPFCLHCDRLRLSSEGDLRGCLSSTQTFPLKNLLDLPYEAAQEKLETLLRAALATKRELSFDGTGVLMKSVGG